MTKENRLYIEWNLSNPLSMNFVSPFQPEKEFKVYNSCKCSQVIRSTVKENRIYCIKSAGSTLQCIYITCWVDSTVHIQNVLGRLYSAYTERAWSSLQCIYRTCLVDSTVHIQNVLGGLYSAYTERTGSTLQCIYRTCWVVSTVHIQNVLGRLYSVVHWHWGRLRSGAYTGF